MTPLTSVAAYPYAAGDPVATPQAYTYTPFQGAPFLNSWQRARQDTVSGIRPTEPPAARPTTLKETIALIRSKHISTPDLLETLFAAFRPESTLNDTALTATHGLLKAFETSKRIHTVYTEHFRAAPNTEFENLALYLRSAEVFEIAYTRTGKLYFLNGLLKIIDTLCAKFNELTDSEQGRVAWLVEREATHVGVLADAKGIKA